MFYIKNVSNLSEQCFTYTLSTLYQHSNTPASCRYKPAKPTFLVWKVTVTRSANGYSNTQC